MLDRRRYPGVFPQATLVKIWVGTLGHRCKRRCVGRAGLIASTHECGVLSAAGLYSGLSKLSI